MVKRLRREKRYNVGIELHDREGGSVMRMRKKMRGKIQWVYSVGIERYMGGEEARR